VVSQQMDFTVLAYPGTTFHANVDHVAAALDPNIRRLTVRATIQNANRLFKPEMFANVVIYTEEGDSSVAVPRGKLIQVLQGLRPGETVVTMGSLFVDQAAGSS